MLDGATGESFFRWPHTYLTTEKQRGFTLTPCKGAGQCVEGCELKAL